MTIRFFVFSLALMAVSADAVEAASLRAELTTSHPDRWMALYVISRTAIDYPNTVAVHDTQSNCHPWSLDTISTPFAGSAWHTPPSPAEPLVFIIDAVDPLEILDFHIRVTACTVGGTFDYTHPWVTGTLRLYEDGVLISTTQAVVRNCCDDGWDSLPAIGTFPLGATPPTVRFAPSEAGSAAHQIMNREQTLGYPSSFQSRLRADSALTDIGGMVAVELTLVGVDGTPAAHTDVYATLTDPPDPAPYRGDRHEGDNRDPDPPHVSGAEGYEVGTLGDAVILRSDDAGRINARIHGSKDEAGDNYRLRISLYRPVAATDLCSASDRAKPCFESQVFTIWKRFVVEKDQMFRRGTFLAEGYTDGLTVRVVPDRQFHPTAGAVLMFIRSTPSGVTSELRTVARYRRGVITLDTPLTGSYVGPPGPNLDHLADGVGIVGDGTYDVRLEPLRAELRNAFVDVWERSQRTPYFPFVGRMTEPEMRALSKRWQEGDADVHLVAARYRDMDEFGSQALDWSYVWTQQCIDYSNETALLKDEVAAHEVIHRWDLSIAAGRSTDHCDLNAWSDVTRRCTMHTNVQNVPTRPNQAAPVRPEFLDGRVEFHYVIGNSGVDSEYLMLRAHGGIR